MTDADRQKLRLRYEELERILNDIRAGVINNDDTGALEAQCLKEQDEIDYWLDIFNWGE